MCSFDLADLASPDTGMVMVNPRLVDSINSLMLLYAFTPDKLIITSGYRTSKHNKKVGGAKRSYHLRGMAVDMYCKYLTHAQLGRRALNCDFTTAIVYKSHVHLDIREKGLGLRKKGGE